MTANAMVEDQLACAAAGMNGHIAKPIDAAALYSKLMQHLGRSTIQTPESPSSD